MAHPFDVIGYTADADVYCPPCARNIYGDGISGENGIKDREGNLVGPVFADSEWDYPVSCGKCLEFIDANLTNDGIQVAYEMIAESYDRKAVTPFLMKVADSLLWKRLGNDEATHIRRFNEVLAYVDLGSRNAAQL